MAELKKVAKFIEAKFFQRKKPEKKAAVPQPQKSVLPRRETIREKLQAAAETPTIFTG